MKSYRQNYEQLWTASTKQDEQQHSIQIKFVSELQSHEMSSINYYCLSKIKNDLHNQEIITYILLTVFMKNGCCKLSLCGFLLSHPHKYVHFHLISQILVQLDHENFQLLLSCNFKDLILSEFLFIQNCSQNNNKVIL